jgi:hypothetical protein
MPFPFAFTWLNDIQTVSYSRSRSDHLRNPVSFDEVIWLVACPPTLEQALKMHSPMQFYIKEMGTGSAPRKSNNRSCCVSCLCWFCCFLCSIISLLFCILSRLLKLGRDGTAALFGGVRIIGVRKRMTIGMLANLKMSHALKEFTPTKN